MQSVLLTSLPATGAPVGLLICAWWTRRRQFSSGELRLVEGLAAQAAIAIVNARLYAKTEELAVRRERARVAGVLHDMLGQMLFSVTLKLSRCVRSLPHASELRSKLGEIKQETDLMLTQMRDVIFHLSDAAGPFSDRLQKLVEHFREVSGIQVEFEARGDVLRLAQQQQDVILKTFQEGLANIAKHSTATRAEVRLEIRGDQVQFEVTDDGIGPAADPVALLTETRRHFGLRQIFECLTGLGGRLELCRNSPSGFRLRGILPLPPSGACQRSAS